ncbi:MAG: hypothetical protein AB7V00_05385 [Bacilli bacterium]
MNSQSNEQNNSQEPKYDGGCEKSPKEIIKTKSRHVSLYLGLISLGFGLLFGGFYLPVIAILLGALGLILVVIDHKKTKSLFLAGIILGTLGITFGALSFYASFINKQMAHFAYITYNQELTIDIPEIKPDFYFIAFGIFASIEDLPRKEFHYNLNDVDNETFNLGITYDHRWLDLPFSDSTSSFLGTFNLDLDYFGKYLLFDRIEGRFGDLVDLENYQNDYNFVLVIYDYEANTLIIYDIYQS